MLDACSLKYDLRRNSPTIIDLEALLDAGFTNKLYVQRSATRIGNHAELHLANVAIASGQGKHQTTN
jgi:hypothetical protein